MPAYETEVEWGRLPAAAIRRRVDGFIFFNTMNGELDRLHRKYLDMPMDPLPTL